MDPYRPETRGCLVGPAVTRWRHESKGIADWVSNCFLFLFLLSLYVISNLAFQTIIWITWMRVYSKYHTFDFTSLSRNMHCRWIVHVSRSFSPALVSSHFTGLKSMDMLLGTCAITTSSVRLMADGSKGLCWPDAGRLSQAAGRSAALCWSECAHCHSLLHTPSILYFPVRDLHPSVIPLSSVPQTEGFWRESVRREGRGPGTKLPLWEWLTGKLFSTDVTINEASDWAADAQTG